MLVLSLAMALSVFAAYALRRPAALLASASVPLYYLGLHAGWWGGGVGDGWLVMAGLATAMTLILSAVALSYGRARGVR